VEFRPQPRKKAFGAILCFSFSVLLKTSKSLFCETADRQHGAESNDAVEPKVLFSCFLLLKKFQNRLF
jgi:hypothetical protein